MWTLCSLGSNIEPETNLPIALERLARWFSTLQVSPLIRTEAVGIMGTQPFMNGLVRFYTDLSDAELKQRLNALETDLGRDRGHPDKKRLPRPLDIDIQDRKPRLDMLRPGESTEYMERMWQADQGQIDTDGTWPVELANQLLGEKAAAVYFDHRSGEIRVVPKQIDRVQNRSQAALASQQRVS